MSKLHDAVDAAIGTGLMEPIVAEGLRVAVRSVEPQTPNPLTPRVLADMEAQALGSLMFYCPQELAVPLIRAAMRAHESGLLAAPPEPAPPPPIDPGARARM